MISVSFEGENGTKVNENQISKEFDTLSGTNNSIFSMKVTQNKSQLSDASGHEVTFDVTFAMAIPGVFTTTKQHESKRISVSESSTRNNHQFFHLEFDLFSEDVSNESFKTDIGFYGTYAKIYPDKSDSKVIPTWTDGEDTWISWIQQFRFWITDQHIRDLCTHKMKVFIWDTKDKCAPKVRFDRPKPPRSASRSKATNENCSWIKHTILMISKDYSTTVMNVEENDRMLPHQIVASQLVKKPQEKPSHNVKSAKTSSTAKSSISSPDMKVKESDRLVLLMTPKDVTNTGLESYSQLEKLLEPFPTENPVKHKVAYSNYSSKIKTPISNAKESLSTPLPYHSENHLILESRKSVTIQMDNDSYHNNGRTSLGINMPDLFLKNQTINRIPNSINSLEDMFCRVSIEPDVLSPDQKKRLNPFIIKIRKINNLPIIDEKINEINKKYKPIFCEYQFSDFPRYRTIERSHRKSIPFNDISIVLFGELPEVKIKEQLLNSFFTIQIFNRIKQDCPEIAEMELGILEDLGKDKNIGDIHFTSAYNTVIKPAVTNPQGEARIDLSDIINKSLKFLEITIPIVPVSAMALKEDNENRTKQTNEDQVDFIESETTIKVSFQLAEALPQKWNSLSVGVHFNRMVVVNDNMSCDFLRNTCARFILKHNCEVLNFKGSDSNEMKQFLYRMKNQHPVPEDAFGGFFLVDKKYELLFVEGHQKNMKMLHDHCSGTLNAYRRKSDHSMGLKLLYNDILLFKERENFPILTMIPLVLSKDISFFSSQPLLYVRDILPKNCVEGICRLKDLLTADSMQVVTRNNLVPSFQMIEDLSQYLCSHIESQMANTFSDIQEDDPNLKLLKRKLQRKQIKTAPVISHRKKDENNINNNDRKIQLPMTYVYPEEDCEFSYSSQSKNAISSALKEVRNQMDSKRRYTFSQTFHFSGSVDPVDVNDVYLDEERKIRTEPRWQYRGSRTAMEDNVGSENLSDSRIGDLKEPWKENELNRSFMEPTIPERDQTEYNFDTYIRPLNLFGRNPVSMMPPYAIQRQYEKEQLKNSYNIWKSKFCVEDPNFKTHRLSAQTELTEKGRRSSNQIAKLKGLRKDNLKVINWIVRRYGDPNSISSINVLPAEETPSRAYTVGSDNNAPLNVNYVPTNDKDKDFKSVYQPSKDSQVYKNPNPKVTFQTPSPFSVTC